LNAGAGILSISKSTGTLFGTTNFEHYILSIISAYDTLFVVVGPNVNAYTDYSNNAIASPNLLLTVYQQIIVIVIISLVIIVLLILAYRKYRNKYNTSETVQSIQFST
jgi:heme/copper-type cytochrome/quinol oxidase subunit 2